MEGQKWMMAGKNEKTRFSVNLRNLPQLKEKFQNRIRTASRRLSLKTKISEFYVSNLFQNSVNFHLVKR